MSTKDERTSSGNRSERRIPNWGAVRPTIMLMLVVSFWCDGAWAGDDKRFEAALACRFPIGETRSVSGIVDARTIRFNSDREFVLAGILPPGNYDSPAAGPVGDHQRNSLDALNQFLTRGDLRVVTPSAIPDRYGRLVGFVFAGDASLASQSMVRPQKSNWVQGKLVAQGHARVLLTPGLDAPCATYLLGLEAKAAAARRGLWASEFYRARRAEDLRELHRLRSTYQVVEGIVARVSVRANAAYLNFGDNWRRDFTVKLTRRVLRNSRIDRKALTQLRKQAVRVRGWIEKRNGPLIHVWRLAQIERVAVGADGALKRYNPPRLLSDVAPSARADRQD